MDSRLGRWFSVDPLERDYPWQSPYCSMDANPLNLNDVHGLGGEYANLNKNAPDGDHKEAANIMANNLNGQTWTDPTTGIKYEQTAKAIHHDGFSEVIVDVHELKETMLTAEEKKGLDMYPTSAMADKEELRRKQEKSGRNDGMTVGKGLSASFMFKDSETAEGMYSKLVKVGVPGDVADDIFYEGWEQFKDNVNEVENSLNRSRPPRVIEMFARVVNGVPGGVYNAVIGEDWINGSKLEPAERILAGLGVVFEGAVIFKALNPTKIPILEKHMVDYLGEPYSGVASQVHTINKTDLLAFLNKAEPGDWVKVYEAGYMGTHKIEVHYFINKKTGSMFDIKIKRDGWSKSNFTKGKNKVTNH